MPKHFCNNCNTTVPIVDYYDNEGLCDDCKSRKDLKANLSKKSPGKISHCEGCSKAFPVEDLLFGLCPDCDADASNGFTKGLD